jgi:hypothetical protein
MSREDCVFPYSYFEAVMMNYDDRGWDYFGLCGCPVGLVKLVMRLARLSAEKRRSLSMERVLFDDSAVTELEDELRAWHHVPPPAAYVNEESMHLDRDNMHCAEAWRNGMLLYIHRVFRWERGTSFSMCASVCARTVTDHIFACREGSMIARQALVPLFFAGCELQDVSIRKRILKLCRLWNDRTRYYMFGTTIPLLKDVWDELEKGGEDTAWWGQVVDSWHRSPIDSHLRSRLCFG